MIGFRGMSVESAPEIAADITQRRIGGVVLFDYDVPDRSPSRNITSPEQLSRLTLALQKLSKIPLFIAIDADYLSKTKKLYFDGNNLTDFGD